VAVHKPEQVNHEPLCSHLRSLGAEAWVVIAFGQKLSPQLLLDQKAMNLHASLLPRWRGAAPIHAAILAGDTETGNSVITLADRMDAGLVLAQSRRSIEASQTTEDLHEALSQDGPALIESCLQRSRHEWPFGSVQDASMVTLARKLSKDDGWIDFNEGAEVCRRRIHGLNPWPTVTVQFRGADFKILRAASKAGASNCAPGTLLDSGRGEVTCGGSSILTLVEVQSPGKRAMKWSEFAAGRQPAAGEVLTGGRPEAKP
jgi:methionyl-tRNA formyltransferase